MDFLGGGVLWEEEELCNLRSLKDMLESKIISALLNSKRPRCSMLWQHSNEK